MTASRDGGVRRGVGIVSLLLLAAVAGCGPLNVRSVGWTLFGLDLGRSLARIFGGADGAPPGRSFIDEFQMAIDQSMGTRPESDVRFLREAYRRQERPYVQAIAALESLDQERFDRMWKTDLVARDVRAGDLLRDLAAGMDLHLEDRLVPGGLLDRPVTLDLRGVSRFEAMERVCTAIGIHADPVSAIALPPTYARGPVRFDDLATRSSWEAISLKPYEDFVSPLEFLGFPADKPHDPAILLAPPRRPTVVLMPGPAPGPRCPIGPFTVIVGRPVEFPGDMCGSIDIVATCAAIPEPVRRILLLEGMGRGPTACAGKFRCRIEIDTDEGGHLDRRFAARDEGCADSTLPMIPTHAWARRRMVRLGPDTREVKVTGRVVAWIPGAVETIRIDAPGKGPHRIERPAATASIGERLPRPDVAESPESARAFELPVDLEVPETSTAFAVAVDERGVPFEMVTIDRPNDGEAERPAETPGRVVLRSLLRCSREPAAILLKVAHAQVSIERPFEVSVPLSFSASQPEGPKALEFDGERPLDLEAAPNAAGKTVFRLTNRSNKGIVRVGYSVIDFWIDKKAGRAVERAIEKVEGYHPLEAVIVPAGGAVDWPRDFFYHENPDGELPTLRVDEVEFTDGTLWVNRDRFPAS